MKKIESIAQKVFAVHHHTTGNEEMNKKLNRYVGKDKDGFTA